MLDKIATFGGIVFMAGGFILLSVLLYAVGAKVYPLIVSTQPLDWVRMGAVLAASGFLILGVSSWVVVIKKRRALGKTKGE